MGSFLFFFLIARHGGYCKCDSRGQQQWGQGLVSTSLQSPGGRCCCWVQFLLDLQGKEGLGPGPDAEEAPGPGLSRALPRGCCVLGDKPLELPGLVNKTGGSPLPQPARLHKTLTLQ